MKNHKPWTITAKSGGEIEILLYEMIGEDFWTGEGTTAKAFAEDLKAAGKVSKIHLRVNSPGGNVFDGIAIYNTLLSHGATVTAQVDGIAASIASVITMAASEISMADNGMMMIHNPSTLVAGDSNDMRKMADTMDKVKASMVTAYRRHCALSADAIGALMDEETWMTAAEAVEQGFAETMTTPAGEEEEAVAANFGQVFAHFRKVPTQIAARFGVRARPTPPRVDAGSISILAEDPVCGCACTACMKDEADCANCTKGDCGDSVCAGAGCPMQKKAAAAAAAAQTALLGSLRGELRASMETIQNLEAQIERQSGANRAEIARWLPRMSSELERSAELYAAASSKLTGRCAAAETLQAEVRARVDRAEALLGRIQAERAGEVTNLAQWAERVSGELRQSSTLSASALAEITLRSRLQGEIRSRVEAAEKVLAQLKTHRAGELSALTNWTQRVTGDLQHSAELYATAAQEIARRVQATQSSAAGTGKRLAAAETALTQLKADRTAETAAVLQWTQRVTALLEESVRLQGAAVEEAGRRSRMAPSADDATHARMEDALNMLKRLKDDRAAEVLSLILSQVQSDRSAELTAVTQSAGRLTTDLQAAAKLSASALEEVGRRSRLAESAGEMSSQIQAAETLLTELKAQHAAETTATAEWAAAVTAQLQESQTLQGAAVEEVGRRSRLAEASEEIGSHLETAETLLAQFKSEREAEATAVTEWTAGVSGELRESARLLASAGDEIARRARLADSAGGSAELDAAQTLFTELKSALASAPAASEALAELNQAGTLYRAAVEEIGRRARLAAIA